MRVKKHSLVDLPSPSPWGNHFDHPIDGGRGQLFEFQFINLCVKNIRFVNP